jgi:hypothetical protein
MNCSVGENISVMSYNLKWATKPLVDNCNVAISQVRHKKMLRFLRPLIMQITEQLTLFDVIIINTLVH